MKRKKEYKVYYCPHCGNDAPYYMKPNAKWRCKFCKVVYSKEERVRGNA